MPKPRQRPAAVAPADRAPSWPASARVGEVRTRAARIQVLRGGRPCGHVPTEVLTHARQLGLTHLRLEELLAGERAENRGHAARAPAPARICELLARLAGAQALELLREIGARAAERGWPSALVGGVVRDLLLERPCRDLDVVVEGPAADLAAAVSARHGGALTVHGEFGTAAVELPDGRRIDFATARRETYEAPAALPRVRAASLVEDAWRRDFTFNALRVRLDPESFGRFEDDVGGLDDLRLRRLRLLHGMSLLDDPTRAFRAVRFGVRFGFRTLPETDRLLRVARRERVFERLSPVRLRREVERLLDAHAQRAVRWLARCGLWEEIDPALKADRATLLRIARAARAVARYRARAPQTELRAWAVVLAAAALGLAPLARRRLVARLRPGRAEAELIERAPLAVARLLEQLAAGPREPRPGGLHEHCSEHDAPLLLVARCAAPAALGRALERYVARRESVRLDIGGRDLLRAGLAPGPRVAIGLHAALRARLDGRAARPEEQLALALAAAGDA